MHVTQNRPHHFATTTTRSFLLLGPPAANVYLPPPLPPLLPCCSQGVAPTLLDVNLEDLEGAFRSVLLKLQFIDNLVAPLPPGGLSGAG